MESDEVINQLWTISINQINFANLEHYMNLNNVESYAHIERKYQPWICNVSFAKNRLAWTIELMNINITFRFDFYWVSRNGSSGLRLILVGVAGCEAIKKHWHGLLEWPLSGTRLSRVPHYHWIGALGMDRCIGSHPVHTKFLTPSCIQGLNISS